MGGTTGSRRLNKPLIASRTRTLILTTLNHPLPLPLHHPLISLAADTNSTVLTIPIPPIRTLAIATISTSQQTPGPRLESTPNSKSQSDREFQPKPRAVAGEAGLPLPLSLIPLLFCSLLAVFGTGRRGEGGGADHKTAVGVFGALLARPGHTGSRGRGLVVVFGGGVGCGVWCGWAESAVGEVFVFFFLFAFTTANAGWFRCAASVFWRNEEALTVVLMLADAAVAAAVVAAVGAEETTLSHRSEQYADKPPLNITEWSRELHARLCVLEEMSGELDGGVPEVTEKTAEAIDQRVAPC
jgi:hypothetical protein